MSAAMVKNSNKNVLEIDSFCEHWFELGFICSTHRKAKIVFFARKFLKKIRASWNSRNKNAHNHNLFNIDWDVRNVVASNYLCSFSNVWCIYKQRKGDQKISNYSPQKQTNVVFFLASDKGRSTIYIHTYMCTCALQYWNSISKLGYK